MLRAKSSESAHRSSAKPLGIIAGGGRLPLLLAREIRASRSLVIVSIVNEPEDELVACAEVFHHIGMGRLRQILRAFEKAGASELVILGGVPKEVLFQPYRLDALALKILRRTKMRGDQALFCAIADEFTTRGFTIADQRTYLGSLLPERGVLTRRKPSRQQERDAAMALELARQVAALDVGQTVVLKNGVPLAVEAIEGSDAAIRRGGALGGAGVIVAKAARPEHDFRFDVPTVGLDTLAALREVRASLLVLEAGRAFLLDGEEFLNAADAAKIAILAL